MPDPAPVTMAIRSFRLMSLLSFSRSDGQSVAVAARVGAGHEGTRLGAARDALAAAHDPRPVVDDIDLVSACGQGLSRLGGHARLGVDEAVAVDAHARRLDRLLDVHPELERVE